MLAYPQKKSTFIGTARYSMAPLKTFRKNKWHKASRSPDGRYGLYSRKPGVDGCEAAVDGCHVVSQSLCNLLPPSPPSITGASVESAAGKQKKKTQEAKSCSCSLSFFLSACCNWGCNQRLILLETNLLVFFFGLVTIIFFIFQHLFWTPLIFTPYTAVLDCICLFVF